MSPPPKKKSEYLGVKTEIPPPNEVIFSQALLLQKECLGEQ